MIRSHCEADLPGLEVLLLAALRLSVIPDEGRYPRIRIRATYKRHYPLLLNLDLPLDRLADVAPAVHYSEGALLCKWNGEWKICGITKASLAHDGVGLDITAPLCMSIARPDSLRHMLSVVRGQVSESQSWETVIADLGDEMPGGVGGSRAYVLARATYKASIEGHGGAFLVLPPDPDSCLMDISIRFRATPGPEFERLLLQPPGHWDNRLIEDCSDALLALTRVDGAVVMNRDLWPVGFGATITASMDESRAAHGGHRHRSAMTLCNKHGGTVAIVVSQDGPITVYGGRVSPGPRISPIQP